MSYDISLTDPKSGETIQLDELHDIKGGTYALGGTREAWLNITWNYGEHFYRVFAPRPATDFDRRTWMGPHRQDEDIVEGIRVIYGLTGEESIPILRAAREQLGSDATDDYWEATEGNAARALQGLIDLALMAPHGVWKGD